MQSSVFRKLPVQTSRAKQGGLSCQVSFTIAILPPLFLYVKGESHVNSSLIFPLINCCATDPFSYNASHSIPLAQVPWLSLMPTDRTYFLICFLNHPFVSKRIVWPPYQNTRDFIIHTQSASLRPLLLFSLPGIRIHKENSR